MLPEITVIDRASGAVVATHTVEAHTLGGLERHAARLQSQYGETVLIDDSAADRALRGRLGLPCDPKCTAIESPQSSR